MFKGAVGQTASQEQCVSATQAKAGAESMTKAFEQGGDCTVGEFTTEGGVVKGSMTCSMPDGSRSEMEIAGNIAPDNFTMTMKTELAQEMLPGGKANVTMEVTGERLGECDA